MAVTTQKEQEREEIYRSIWATADKLRGAVDGWDFKNYVLGAMFYRYISENLTAYINKGDSAQGGAFEDQFKDLFADFDVNSNKLGSSVAKRNERLTAILTASLK